MRISGGIMAGQILTKVSPLIGPEVCQDRPSGTVVILAIIGTDGHVKVATAVSGPKVVLRPVLDAVRQFVYKPYLVNGQPVEVQTTVTTHVDVDCGPSPQKTPPPQPVRISGGVIAANLLTKIVPTIPEEARAKHINGTVVVHAVIGKDGHVKSAEAVSGPDLLRPAYLDAIKQWTYKPYLLNGKPVEVDTTITLNIQMNGS